MSKDIELFFHNVITAFLYVILAMFFCAYMIGTKPFLWALYIGCIGFVVSLAVYFYKKRLA